MNNIDVMFSSKSDEWATPQHIFDELNNEFNFDLDPCANFENHKCSDFYTMDQDGLLQDWCGRRVFCNPPYSNISEWVKKSFFETKNKNTLVVLLIPARTDTKYFQDYILNRSEIRFIRGRLKFGDGKNPAPFPSMIVIFRGAEVL